MRARIIAGILLLSSILFVALWIRFTPGVSSQVKETPSANANVSVVPRVKGEDEGIWAIENQLLPPFLPKGRPASQRGVLSRMKELRVPAVSIAVVRNAELRWARAYGSADVSSVRSATTQTLFQAASLSKPVAAAAALTLVEDGKFALDEDVNQKLTSWKVPASETNAFRKVTLRRLLSHSAGLTVDGFPGYPSDKPQPTLRQILDGQPPANTKAVRLELEPGLQYRYSGGGYEVVHLLIGDLTGSRFEDVVRERILQPLEMANSTYDLSGGTPRDLATGYTGEGKPLEGGHYVYPELAAAGLWTTPSDFARFGAELQRARQGRSSRMLSRDIVVEMLSEQMKPAGLGFELHEGAAKWFFHTGMNAGFQSLALFNEGGDGIVVMTNSDTGMILARELVATIARAYGWNDYYPEERPTASTTAEKLKEYAGSYSAGRFGTIVVEARNDRLLIGTQSRPSIEFFPESDLMFFPETPGYKAKFRRNFLGNVSAISFGKMVAPKS
jgi:CubicO group peptidase (beta-lactamase class C family)